MSTTGYSGTPLIDKLGIKSSMKLLLIDAPDDYFRLLGTDTCEQLGSMKDIPGLVHLFVKTEKAFETSMNHLKSVYPKERIGNHLSHGVRKVQRSQLI